MRLVYKCLHCGKSKADHYQAGDISHLLVLDIAYGQDMLIKEQMNLGAYQPHPCEPNVTGVAQLVAVLET